MKQIYILVFLFFSLNGFAETKFMNGIIRQIECNRPSGLGHIQLEVRSLLNMTMKNYFLRVNSKELCGSEPNAPTLLGEVGYEALFLGKVYLFKVKIENNFVTGIEQVKPIAELDYYKNYLTWENINQQEVMSWFYNGPVYINYNQDNIDELIAKYTRE
ncbi:MAG: hypothetical protein AB7I27_14565 [Bacteriovoracaceae bacterium]